MLAMDFPGFRAVSVQTVESVVYVTLETTTEAGCCPSCGVESKHIHSYYVRSLRDLPALGRPVRLRILARRFRCLVSECRRKTFCERLEGMAKQHAQRTDRLTATLQSLILSSSSPTGARLAQQMGIETSARTLLRVVNHGEHHVPAPRFLGVDDFALRKGHSYGTLLCDLETGTPIDILPGRLAGPLTEWLKAHPGVEVIARDRATAYADAARAGAPNAVQVADRFHLVKNVSDALKEIVDRQPWSVPAPKVMPVSPIVEVVPSQKSTTRQAMLRAEAAERRQARYDIIQQRLAMGESLRAICRATGLSRATVRKYVRSAGVPERAVRRHHSNLDPFADYLRERWSVGCHNVRQLYREVVGLGYAGSESMLRTYVRAWREKPSCSSGEHQARVNQVVWKDLRWTILRPKEHLRTEDAHLLAEFLHMHPQLEQAYGLVQAFREMLKEHRVEELDHWLSEASQSGLPPLQRLAKSLANDRAAVLAGIELKWSTGPVEGQITRLKLLKRIGYGRASLPLLRARVTGIA